MKRTTGGVILLIGAAGMMAGLLGGELKDLQSWVYVTTPAFFGKTLMHIATVIGAYVAGQMIPTSDHFKGEQP